MKLIESDERLARAARDFEVHAAPVKALEGLELAVELADFRNLNTAQRAYLDTNAAYQVSTGKILINASFLELGSVEQRGVLAHEVAHAIDHRGRLIEKLPSEFRIGLHPEEFLADWLACSWGFLDAVCAMRSSWGARYVANLELWERESEYYAAMKKWNLQRSAGII